MKYLPILAIIAFITLSCSNNKKATVTKESDNKKQELAISKTLLLQVTTTACFGSCPVYEMSIYRNGSVSYQGHRYIQPEGAYTGKISQDEVDDIIQRIKDIQFFELKDVYDEPVTDIPSTTVMVILDGKKKVVKARMGHPDKLDKFNKFLYELTQKISWKNAQQ